MDNSIRKIIFIAVFAALISVGSIIGIPIGPVNIMLANFFIFLAAFILGFPWAAASVAVFLLLGLIGIPVFQNGGSGISHFAGPTGGFLPGYLLAALLIPLIADTGKKSLIKDIIAITAGILIIYLPGIPWLKYKLDFNWPEAFAAGFTPYILFDIIKGAAAVFLARSVPFRLKKADA